MPRPVAELIQFSVEFLFSIVASLPGMTSSSPKPGDRLELDLDSDSKLTMAFRYIPACPEGFLMGSRARSDAQPVHRVILAEGFWLGETVVTRAQFRVWTKSTSYHTWLEKNRDMQFSNAQDPHENSFDHGSPEEYPAERLSWYEARGYCEWLNETGLTKGEGVAGLPSEAQWEFACAGGEQTEYENGDGVAALDAVGWFDENSEGKTQPVRSKQANLFGLYDMHGNVWEWCRDAWDSEAYAKRKRNAEDPEAYLEGEETSRSVRVLRGGAWVDSAAFCRSAYRTGFFAGCRDGGDGFRVGLFPGPKNQANIHRASGVRPQRDSQPSSNETEP